MKISLQSAQKFVILGTCMLGQCVTCGTISILGAFTENFLHSFKVSNANVALTCAVCQSLFCGAGPLSLWLLKLFGYRICVITAGVLSCFCFICASLATHFIWIALFLGGILGLMVNLTLFSTVVVIPEYFSCQRGRKVAYGVIAIGAGIGFLIFPIIVTSFQSQYNWRHCLQLIGAITLNIIPLGVALPNRGVKSEGSNNSGSSHSISKRSSAESVNTIVIKSREERELIEDKRSDRLSLWTNPFLYLTFVAFFLGYGAIAAFYTFVFLSFEQQGLQTSDAAFVLLLMGGVSVPSRIAYTLLCRWCTMPTYIQWCLVVALCNFGTASVTFFSTKWSLTIVAACLGGSTYGLIWPMHPIVIADLFRPKQFPIMLSLTFFVLGIGGLCGPLIAGLLVDRFEVYAIALSGLGYFVSVLFIFPVAIGLYHSYIAKKVFKIE